jgi:ubiquinone/menaquinone biosynthesis C-methylase UbiE
MFIDPLLASGRKNTVAEIEAGQTVLDVACGTGALVFELSQKAKKVVGVDVSEPMINSAKKEIKKRSLKNVELIVANATNLSLFTDNKFDVVTLSMALHQFDPALHTPILKEIERVGKKLIVVDYAVPLPQNVGGISARIIEFMAGTEHHRNFRKYYNQGGLNHILTENLCDIEYLEYFSSGIFQLMKCRFQ